MADPIDTAVLLELSPTDIDSAWELFQGLQLVSYQEYNGATDSYTTVHTSIQALTEEEDRKEVDKGDGNFVFTKTRFFNMRVSTFAGVNVTKRGKITEANGTVWIVMYSLYRSFKTRWKCECYALNG